MYKDVLRSIGDVATWSNIGLIIFVLFFTLMITWTLMRKSSYIEKMAQMPIEDSAEVEQQSTEVVG